MNKFFKYVSDNIFTLIFMALSALFIYGVFMITEAETNAREKARKIAEACYSQGFVPVDTDAGKRCADPRGLVKIK